MSSKSIMKSLIKLERSIPAKVSPEILRDYVDVILLKGAVEMGKIVVSPTEEKVVKDEGSNTEIKIMDPTNKIKAFNSIVGLGKYIEQRINNSKQEEGLYSDDFIDEELRVNSSEDRGEEDI